MILTKNVYFRLVKLVRFLTQKSRTFQNRFNTRHALKVIITILNNSFQVPITYRFRNLTYLVILVKKYTFKLVKLPFYIPKNQHFQNRFNMR